MSKYKILILLLMMVLFSSSSYSQFKSKEKENEENPLNKLLNKNGVTNSNTSINADAPEIFGQIEGQNTYKSKSVPIEGAIDANKYIVGPNDLFTLGLYGYINQQVPVVVSPEGSIIIPTVGEVKVSGVTLNEAKEVIK
jgi:protein involved in polysaccharide export with SLBB domain